MNSNLDSNLIENINLDSNLIENINLDSNLIVNSNLDSNLIENINLEIGSSKRGAKLTFFAEMSGNHYFGRRKTYTNGNN